LFDVTIEQEQRRMRESVSDDVTLIFTTQFFLDLQSELTSRRFVIGEMKED